MNNYVEKIRRGDSLTNFHDVELRETVDNIIEELSDLDTNVKDILDKFNDLGLSVVDGKLCQTYNT